MGLTEKVAIGILILFVVGAVLRLFKTPLKLAMQVLLNTLLGFGALFLLNLTQALTGISLGVNLLNALVIGDSLTSDIQGANNAGLPCCWFNPKGQPRPQGLRIDYEIRALEELYAIV